MFWWLEINDLVTAVGLRESNIQQDLGQHEAQGTQSSNPLLWIHQAQRRLYGMRATIQSKHLFPVGIKYFLSSQDLLVILCKQQVYCLPRPEDEHTALNDAVKAPRNSHVASLLPTEI
jgi:hypothetical protein